jgi:hypothetical protein
LLQVQVAKYFSVLADETTDVSHKEQLCVCIRFVDKANGKHIIKEEFLQFQSVTDLTAKGLSETLLTTLQQHKLDLKYLVGQGYDGASVMSGHIGGVQSLIRNVCPLAIYVHCASHVLNLILNTSCSVPEIRDMFAVVGEVTNFINDSAHRREIAKNCFVSEVAGRSLITLCPTRFVERHDALLVFYEQFSQTIDALDKIAEKASDRKVCDRARGLVKAMCDSSFIIALCCSKKVMALTISLSRCLQKVNQDLFEALQAIGHVQKQLEEWRNDEKNEWEHARYGPFVGAKALVEKLNLSLEIPRLAGRQTSRNNMPCRTPSEYYRRAIWYPYLDSMLLALRDKFSFHQRAVFKLTALLPSAIATHSWDDLLPAYEFYASELSSEEEVRHEYEQWKNLCLQLPLERRPTSPIEALDIVPTRLQNIHNLLCIFSTIPVTACTAERSFSSLKLLKTFLRNRMTDERLTGLALLYIHQDVQVDTSVVIDRFSTLSKCSRRINFVL